MNILKTTALALTAASAASLAGPASAALLLTGVIDGDLSGGQPKAIELYSIGVTPDLSVYGIGSANNGGGSDGEEFTLSGSAADGEYIYVAANIADFNTYFGFDPTFTDGAANINGDDAVELFLSGVVVDVYGDIDTNGDGEVWDYTDSFAYRVDATGPDGSTFAPGSWTFAGLGALDGVATAAEGDVPFGTYTPVPEPASLALVALGGVALLGRRRTA